MTNTIASSLALTWLSIRVRGNRPLNELRQSACGSKLSLTLFSKRYYGETSEAPHILINTLTRFRVNLVKLMLLVNVKQGLWTADCGLRTEGKMKTDGKMKTADCGLNWIVLRIPSSRSNRKQTDRPERCSAYEDFDIQANWSADAHRLRLLFITWSFAEAAIVSSPLTIALGFYH